MRLLRAIAAVAVVVAFALAALGSWVRIANAGRLMCADWPLCRGALVPPLGGGLAIEWAHRALASVEGGLILAIVVLAWPHRRSIAGLQASLMALTAIFSIEVGLGGWTVFAARSPASAAAHWAIAMMLLAALVALAIVLFVATPVARGDETAMKLAAAAALAFAAMSIGSYISASFAGLACTGFPGCNDSLAGRTPPQFVQMLHRLVAGSFVVVAALSAVDARRRSSDHAKRAATLGVVLAFAQACLGIATVRLGDPLWAREAHATVAGLTFLVFSAAAVFAALEPKDVKRPVAAAAGAAGAVRA